MDVEGKMSEECELNDKEIELQKDFERACERAVSYTHLTLPTIYSV